MPTVQRLTGINREGVRGLFVRRKPDYVDSFVTGSIIASTVAIPTGAHIARVVTNCDLWVNAQSVSAAAFLPSANGIVGTGVFLITSAVPDTFEIGNGMSSISVITPAIGRFSIEWYK